MAGYDAGLLSFPRVGGSVLVGCVSIRPSMLEGSCCVRHGSFRFRIFLIGIAYTTALSRGENIQLCCLYRRMRSCVL